MDWIVTLWFAAGLGLPANDAVSVLSVEDYFKSRRIAVNASTAKLRSATTTLRGGA